METKQFNELKNLIEAHKEASSKDREKQIELIEETIKKVVNGKIDRLSQNVDDSKTTMEMFITRATPCVDFFENMTWVKKFIIGFFGFVTIVIAGILAVKNLWK